MDDKVRTALDAVKDLIPAEWLDWAHMNKKRLGIAFTLWAICAHMWMAHDLEHFILYVGCALGVGVLPNGKGFPSLHRQTQENPFLPSDYRERLEAK